MRHSRQNARLVTGILIVGGTLTLLLVTNALIADSSEGWKFGLLIAVAAMYAGLLRLRDHYFPANTIKAQEDSRSALMQKLGDPWVLVVASFVLTALPLMIIMRSDGSFAPAEATRLAFKVSAWGVLVPAIALMIARFPIQKAAQIFDWWLPSVLLVLWSLVSVRLIPVMALLIAGQPDADSPNVATLLIAPVAAFVWRTFQFVRKDSSR